MQKNQQTNSKFWQTNLISALSFSRDYAYCAIATKLDHIIHIYKVVNFEQVDTWQLMQQLKEHSQTVSDIDWAQDKKIVTCSHDRSVVVWNFNNGHWDKMLVNIDIKLSILVAKWAPSCRKFALGSTCNTLAISYFNTSQNCWVITSRNTLTKSPIISLAFHPSSNLLALGSADYSVKIVTSSFKNSKDQLIISSKVQDYKYEGPFKKIETMFDIVFSIQNLGGWINYVSFQNNGTSLLILPHTNHIKVLDIADNQKIVQGEEDIRWNGLPFLSGYINNSKQLIVGGFDKKVARFVKSGNYIFSGFLTTNQKSNALKAKKNIVSNYAKTIETNKSIYSDSPTESDHLNSIKVAEIRNIPVSYDINGVIHFWSG